jgi:hypothetical protein
VICKRWFKEEVDDAEIGKYMRSCMTVTNLFPWFADSLHETMTNLGLDPSVVALQQFVIKFLIGKFMKSTSPHMKCFIPGPSTSSVLKTLETIAKKNYDPSSSYEFRTSPASIYRPDETVEDCIMIANCFLFLSRLDVEVCH